MRIENDWLYTFGALLVVLGAGAMTYGLFSSGAAPYSETLNLGLLNDKTNLTIAGGFAFTSGLLIAAIESMARRIVRAMAITVRRLAPAQASVVDE